MKNEKLMLSVIILSACIVISLGFYWFQWRPSEIRKNCSVVWRHFDGSPEITAAEAILKNADCERESKNIKGIDYNKILGLGGCNSTARPAQAAKDWAETATDKEYTTCLRKNGLK